MSPFTPSEINSLARQVAEHVRDGHVEWRGEAIAFEAARLHRAAADIATGPWTAEAIAGQALAFLNYWVASEPYAFDEDGRAWRRQHDRLRARIRVLRDWQGDYPALAARLARLHFEFDRLLAREGDRRADAENAALERGERIPNRVELIAA